MLDSFEAEAIGFSAVRIGPPDAPSPVMARAHAHMDVEVNLVLRGWIRYFVPNGIRRIDPGTPAVFWAGIPHRIVEGEEGSEFISLAVPLNVLLEWQLPAPLVAALFRGALLRQADGEPEVSTALFLRWTRDLPPPSEQFSQPPVRYRTAARHEVYAWFQRFADSLERSPTLVHDPLPGRFDAVSRVSRYVCENYADPLSIDQLAGVAELHPKYLMQLFKRTCGLRLWEYVLQVRMSHAQRLLATTPLKVIDVAVSSGFGSLTQFNALFKRNAGMTPTAFRRLHSG